MFNLPQTTPKTPHHPPLETKKGQQPVPRVHCRARPAPGMCTTHNQQDQPVERLLRKEVIQPHLPVRLPSYDFVPIAGPTFTHSLPTRGLGHKFRVLPTFMT